jgi:hypothetical protein
MSGQAPTYRYDSDGNLEPTQFPPGTVCSYVWPANYIHTSLRGKMCRGGPLSCFHRDPLYWCSYHEAHQFTPLEPKDEVFEPVRAALLKRIAAVGGMR